jgi:hypothetical protein
MAATAAGFLSSAEGASDALLQPVSVGWSKHWIKVNRKYPAMERAATKRRM